MRTMSSIGLAAVICLLAVGCGKKDAPKAPAKGESPKVAEKTPGEADKPPEKVAAPAAKPSDGKMQLDKATFTADTVIHVRFTEPIPSPESDRAWVTVVHKGASPSQYGAFVYVGDKAVEATLNAPKVNGAYEVRMHTNYPKQHTNLVAKIGIQVTGGLDPIDKATFTLSADKGKAGEVQPKAKFEPAIVSKPGEKAWITIVPKGAPPEAWGTYVYVPDGASEVTLKSPVKVGPSEVRLHLGYPTHKANIVHSLPFEVLPGAAPAGGLSMTVPSGPAKAGVEIKVVFGQALQAAPGEKYWITVCEAGKPDTEWGQYKYVPAGAKEITVGPVQRAGKYEIRLHGNYPTKPHNVVLRRAIEVK